jgi:hypothetical protein
VRGGAASGGVEKLVNQVLKCGVQRGTVLHYYFVLSNQMKIYHHVVVHDGDVVTGDNE